MSPVNREDRCFGGREVAHMPRFCATRLPEPVRSEAGGPPESLLTPS